ncbi:hypothetical protein GN325_10645 [Agrobacterium vitis]|uniref:Uncharacterized protein n=1 Tax=Agrobacterium vitis TaxID=373 RepID=A0ABD6G936_AGRVI|nr:hypothetical protein [Agrobacterium vitis]MUP05815.1 hypothetical protein [Agrobacterium vitis]MVB02263.1 hypothetical protein [Agrobacterium vitis]NSY11236.1 hypothetical protein [Agrobacterium vitis]NSY20994.1 hypothetical protein [Agrobacterium vitis]
MDCLRKRARLFLDERLKRAFESPLSQNISLSSKTTTIRPIRKIAPIVPPMNFSIFLLLRLWATDKDAIRNRLLQVSQRFWLI